MRETPVSEFSKAQNQLKGANNAINSDVQNTVRWDE